MKTTANISRLKSGGFVLIDDVPCRVDKVSTSSSGKHGHAKVRVDAIGLLDGKRKSLVKPSGEKIDVPIINRNIAQILSIVGDNAQLMDMKTYEVFELPIPEELKGTLEAGKEINYFELVGIKTLKQIK
jgi:translation initiation factor 5A